jgi:hypothetical protein
MGGRGRQREPAEWTGPVGRRRRGPRQIQVPAPAGAARLVHAWRAGRGVGGNTGGCVRGARGWQASAAPHKGGPGTPRAVASPRRGGGSRAVAVAAKKSLYVGIRFGGSGAAGDPYRTPTLVGRGKGPKVDERSSVKELGKLAP